MAKKTINAKEILADIKAGMDNAALMEKYQLSEKGLQSLFKKLTDAGVLKRSRANRKKEALSLKKVLTWPGNALLAASPRRDNPMYALIVVSL